MSATPSPPNPRRPTILFVSGTDTDVGKTYCAAAIARRLAHSGVRLGVYKPVASGCRRQVEGWIADDARQLWNAAGKPKTLRDVCPQCFEAPLAPPEAARIAGAEVDADRLRAAAEPWEQGEFDVLLVEGAGGLLSPLADGVLNIDLARQFEPARLLIVAPNRLGVIHQVLATCEAAQRRGVRPAGILLSCREPAGDLSLETNASQIRRYTDVPILAEVKHGGGVDSLDLETILHDPGSPLNDARTGSPLNDAREAAT